jgi:formate hydrogenlyase subunit 3/multisubunit Na+/H+ antiporter MnhD subunit
MPEAIAYLILFLPLIASVSCFLVNFKKSDFLIFISTIFALLILVIKFSVDFTVLGEIKNDAGFGILSIPTEYRLDFLSLFFLVIILSAQILIAFFYQSDLLSTLKNDNRQLFYATWLLNIFGSVGIFMTNNIFNLFIFIEIYCLTFCALMAMSNDLNLSKLSFKYFCNSVLGSILLLLASVWLYISSGSLQIDNIDNLLFLENSNSIFGLIAIAIGLKFFPINFYFSILKSREILANFLLNFAFIVNGTVGFYLVLRLLFPMFGGDEIFLNGAVLAGFILVFYGNYKMLKSKCLKFFTGNFLLINLGFILVTFFVESSLARLLYISSYIFTGLIMFLLAKLLENNYQTCHFESLKNNCDTRKIVIISAIFFIILNFPITIMFWANWYLVLAAVSSLGGLLVILSIITTNLVMSYMATSLIFTNK